MLLKLVKKWEKRVPWATIFYAFQHNKDRSNERLFETMLFELIKKWEKQVPWATIFYAFQHNKNRRNERLFETMFKRIKKWEKIVFFMTVSHKIVSEKWYWIISALYRHTKLIFICNIQYIHINYIILHLNCILYFPKML